MCPAIWGVPPLSMLTQIGKIRCCDFAYSQQKLQSFVKLAGDPSNPVRFKDDATADELRAEIMTRLEILVEAGVIDLTALPASKGTK